MIFVVTMWIVLVLTGLVLVLGQAMQTEGTISANELSAYQADTVEQAAIQYVIAHCDGLSGKVPTAVDTPCQAVPVGDGAFWIIRNNDTTDDNTYVFGITDELAKVNLNSATQTMLSALPDMTDELASSILAWRSAGTPPPVNGVSGAESDYYLLLDDPYQCKNARLETVDELYLIKGATDGSVGATADIVAGEDVNRNGVMDPGEDVNGDSVLDRGLYPFVTVYTTAPSATSSSSSGQTVVNVSNLTTTRGQNALRTLLANTFGAGRAGVIMRRIVPQPTRRNPNPRPQTFNNLLAFYYGSGLNPNEFQQIADQLTATPATGAVPVPINVNTAPKEVLACLPNLDDNDVAALIAARTDPTIDQPNIAWVTQALTQPKALGIGNYVTTKSYWFSADIVSVSGDGRAFRRCRIVVDANSSPPTLKYRQDLTRLGWPLSQDIITTLRAGAGVVSLTPTQATGQEPRQ